MSINQQIFTQYNQEIEALGMQIETLLDVLEKDSSGDSVPNITIPNITIYDGINTDETCETDETYKSSAEDADSGEPMSILIGNLEFIGPYSKPEELAPTAGIYAVLCEANNEFELLELAESHNVRVCLENEDHANNLTFYQDNCHGNLSAAVYYTPNLLPQERKQLKDRLWDEINSEISS